MVVRQQGSIRSHSQKWPYIIATGSAVLLLGLIVLSLAFPLLTYKGVPLTIILQFLQDPIARQAYFDRNKVGLHRRLDDLGVEAEIKSFYRPRFDSEQELDRYIHQLLFDETGYVGNDYLLNPQGQLMPKSNLPPNFWQWFSLARQLNLAANHETDQGVLYIITPEGTRAPFKLMLQLYPIAQLEQLNALRQSP